MTFTGLVSHVQKFEWSGDRTISFDAGGGASPEFWCEVQEGDSVAVNGVCLTAASVSPSHVTFQLAEETFGLCEFRSPANLELALRADGRVGGHLVSGHINSRGRLISTRGEDWWFWVENAASLIHKGSVAIDGVSLTVAEKDGDRIRVALVPHTLGHTNLGSLRTDWQVNVEVPQALPQAPCKAFCVVYASEWHRELVLPFVEKVAAELGGADTVAVPGAFELPLACQRVARKYDVLVVVGLVLKGETYHFELVANTATRGLMDVQLREDVAIANGLLACYTLDQAAVRLGSTQALVDCARRLLLAHSRL